MCIYFYITFHCIENYDFIYCFIYLFLLDSGVSIFSHSGGSLQTLIERLINNNCGLSSRRYLQSILWIPLKILCKTSL